MDFESMQQSADPRDPRASALLEPASEPAAGSMTLLGLPFDSSIPSRPGARLGPAAFREALGSLTTFDGEIELEPHRCRDLGNLDLPPTSVARAHALVEEASRSIFAAGAIPFFIGGDNGLTGALLRGLAAARPDLRLGLVVIDSHYDVREYDDVESITSGTPYRRALETSICAGARTIIAGTRSFANSSYYHRWAVEQGIRLFPIERFDETPAGEIAREILSILDPQSDAVFLSIDIDAVGSGEAPGSSAAHPAGLRSREAVAFTRAIARSPKLIGADLSELSPTWDVQGMTSKLAARLFLEVFAGIARRAEGSSRDHETENAERRAQK